MAAQKFLIWAWDYGTDSGGGIALHRLAHDLAALGYEAVLRCLHTAPGWLGKPRWQERATPEQIVIYPEIVTGNPLGGERVVRWLLNTPGFFGPGNGDGVYGGADLIMAWDAKYAEGCKLDGLLTAWRDLSHFRDYHRPRAGECYLIRKGHAVPHDQHGPDALCIDDYGKRGGDQYLIDVFNERERFICYDPNTMISTLANLCGVPDIRVIGGAAPLTREQMVAKMAEAEQQTRDFVALCETWWG